MTASQPGNGEYLPAPNVGASMAVEAVPQGVDLGKYAVNGPVHDVVIEPGTGRTFLGGDFTQIGVRTGPVAVVDSPDLGDGKLKPASPEVLGTVRYVFADDRPGDPGFFIVGELIAVNGTPVPASPLTRMHLSAAANRWVVDTTFALDESGGAFCSNLGSFGTWMATEDKLVVGGNTNVLNPVGLWFVDRATGECTASLPGIEQPLPILDGCADQTYCYGTVNRMDWDPETGSLYVVYITWIGADNARDHVVRDALRPGPCDVVVDEAAPGRFGWWLRLLDGSRRRSVAPARRLLAGRRWRRNHQEPPAGRECDHRRDRATLEPLRGAAPRGRRDAGAGK